MKEFKIIVDIFLLGVGLAYIWYVYKALMIPNMDGFTMEFIQTTLMFMLVGKPLEMLSTSLGKNLDAIS